jgi:hypothetical protein
MTDTRLQFWLWIAANQGHWQRGILFAIMGVIGETNERERSQVRVMWDRFGAST